MKAETKQRREDQKAADFLGITLEELYAIKGKEESAEKARQAEAILLFLEQPDKFLEKHCDYCKGIFLTTYKFVGNCSTNCRIKSLERVGIAWNPVKTADDRWRESKIPVEYTIPPAALKVLLELAKKQNGSAPYEVPPNTESSYSVVLDNQVPEPDVEDLLAELGIE